MVRIISALILAVTAVCVFAAEPIKLVDNPPDRHIVVPGDTLWGISGKFLKEPWRWPEIWRLNKDEIKNPHRIYPGDIVLLDLSAGTPRLRLAKPVKMSPKIYSDEVKSAIPSIPPNIIEPFISRPLVIEADGLDKAPRIVASQEDRVFLGNGDLGFVTNIPDASVVKWQGLPSNRSSMAFAWSAKRASCASMGVRPFMKSSLSQRPESSRASFRTEWSSNRFPVSPMNSMRAVLGFWNWFMAIWANTPLRKRRAIRQQSSTSTPSSAR